MDARGGRAAGEPDLRVVRFGDNMREVAVTEGDKVEAQIKLGWQVNTWPVGELVHEIGKVTEAEVDALLDEYRAEYLIVTDSLEAVRYQAEKRSRWSACLHAKARARFPTLSGSVGHATAAGSRLAAAYGEGLRLRRAKATGRGCDDPHREGDDAGHCRRHRVYGGLHLSSRAGQRVSSARTCWRFARPSLRQSRASRCIPWALAAKSGPARLVFEGTQATR